MSKTAKSKIIISVCTILFMFVSACSHIESAFTGMIDDITATENRSGGFLTVTDESVVAAQGVAPTPTPSPTPEPEPEVEPEPIVVESVSITVGGSASTEFTVSVGETVSVRASISPIEAADEFDIVWKSSYPNVADVVPELVNGILGLGAVVHGTGVGTTTISVTIDDVVHEITVHGSR